jgi:hypothetical protein
MYSGWGVARTGQRRGVAHALVERVALHRLRHALQPKREREFPFSAVGTHTTAALAQAVAMCRRAPELREPEPSSLW